MPEMVILNGRMGKHAEALHLLVHGLGDHDTAIRYCLRGGQDIFTASTPNTSAPQAPSKDTQSALFTHLLHSLLSLPDLSERLERTSELLDRFGAWFEIGHVLSLVPETWSVQLLQGFLVHALGRLLGERQETVVVKALCGAQNLRTSVTWGEKSEEVGPMIVTEDGQEGHEVET